MAEVDIKNQHYVWRHYLKPWLTNGKICCLRANKIFIRNVEKVLKKEYFYEAKKLNKDEDQFIEAIIDRMHSSNHELLYDIYAQYKNATDGDTYKKNNYFEKYHSFYEQLAMPLLDNLYNHDIEFWRDDRLRAGLSYFISLQYARTKNLKDRMIMSWLNFYYPKDLPATIRIDVIQMVLSLIVTESIANYIHSYTRPVILQNQSDVHFITGDQPVYNLKAIGDNKKIEEFVAYYPLSPILAVIFSEDTVREICSEHDVHGYNDFIFNISDEFILSKRIEELTKYRILTENTT
jgi:Protein of unknown function (DUF4238)